MPVGFLKTQCPLPWASHIQKACHDCFPVFQEKQLKEECTKIFMPGKALGVELHGN
jgi:hypothetical protein